MVEPEYTARDGSYSELPLVETVYPTSRGRRKNVALPSKSNGLEEVEAWTKTRNSTAIAGLSVRPWMVKPEYTAMGDERTLHCNGLEEVEARTADRNTPTGM